MKVELQVRAQVTHRVWVASQVAFVVASVLPTQIEASPVHVKVVPEASEMLPVMAWLF